MNKIELEKYKYITGYNLSQLEIDYLQNLFLKIIYDKFDTIYFKGGTCLQKCYGLKRFSEDLDFNFVSIEVIKIIKELINYSPYEI